MRVNVEAKIRGNGATNYAVSVVEAASTAQGQVVGTCERGTRKLVYLKANAAGPIVSQPSTATGASVPAAAKPKAPTVITECADGRVTTTGSCKPP